MQVRYVSILIFTLVMLFVLFIGLNQPKSIERSPLIGAPLPKTRLMSIDGNHFSNQEMLGKTWVLHVWSTWCLTCLQEYPLISRIAQQNIPIIGLSYHDNPKSIFKWLKRYGNPFIKMLIDDGEFTFNLGVYGTPETFLIDKHGVIRYKHIGVISENEWEKVLKPIVLAYQKVKL